MTLLYAESFRRTQAMAPLMGFPGLALTGDSVEEALNDAGKQFDAIAALYERFRPEYVFPMMDLTVECEAAGANVRMSKDETPVVEGVLIHDRADLAKLTLPEIGARNRLGVFVETVDRLVRRLPAEAVKCGYFMGPFSMAGRLMGTGELATGIVLEPAFVHELLAYCGALLGRYAEALLATGLDCLWILEPTASLVSPAQADEFSNRYIRPLVARAKKHNVSVVLHNCGRIDHLLPLYGAMGLDGLSIGSAQDMLKTRMALPPELTLFGNLDPSRVFLADRETVQSATTELVELLEETGRWGNYVLASGCDLPPATPLANIEAFMATGRDLARRLKRRAV